MHTENDRSTQEVEGMGDSGEDSQEKGLRWLLEMDLSEPEEKLFTLSEEEFSDGELSAYEAEVAGRPMVRGHAGSDDFASYVDEEIVISSDSARSDIFADSAGGSAEDESAAGPVETMAIDFSRNNAAASPVPAAFVDEGSDILGLDVDDDMGEKFLSIKRVKPVDAEQAEAATTVAAIIPAEQAEAATTVAAIIPAEQTEVVAAAVVPELPESEVDSGWLSSTETAQEAVSVSSVEPADTGWLSGEATASDAETEAEAEAEAEVDDISMLGSLEDEDDSGWLSEAATDDTSVLGLLDDSDDLDWPALGDNTEGDVDDDVFAADISFTEEDDAQGWSFDVESPDASNLSEAPVPGLIAEPGAFNVANEEPVHDEATLGNTAGHDSVVDYVAKLAPPVDDDEFDQYLLGGEHLLDIGADPDDLVVQRTDGIVSVDPSSAIDIDYHEDFRAMEGLAQGSVSAITSVIAQVMEDISSRVRGRMQELGHAADHVEVDVMLGTDAESIKRCYAEGFEPVTAVCTELPVALQGLEKAEQDALYVRLFHGQTNENWNHVFSADQAALQDDFDVLEGALSVAAEVGLDDAAPENHESGFGEDLLAAELSQELGVDAPGEGMVDIDAMFDDFPGEDSDSDVILGSTDMMPEDSPEIAGFGEDIFADEFTEEFSADMWDENAPVVTDINAAFASLDQPQSGLDAICGVDVDEFASAEREDEPVAVEVAGDVETAEATEAAEPVEQDDSGAAWCVPQGIAFSHSTQGSGEIFADFLDAFIEEGSAEIEKLEDLIGEWEKDIAQDAVFASVTRTLHTVKGIAKGVGLQRYGTLVHNYETLLEALPRPEAGEEPAYFRIVNAWLDAVVRGIEHVQECRTDIASEFPLQGAPLVASAENDGESTVEGLHATDAESEQAIVTETVTSTRSGQVSGAEARQKKRDQKLADDGAKALAAQQSVRITSEKLDHLLNLASQAQQLGVRSSQSVNRGKRASSELQGRLTSVRTHIGKIADRALLNVNTRGGRSTPDMDALEMDQYSELQEAASILREGVEDLADLVDLASRQNTLVEALLKQQSSVISSITSSIQAARVVPVSRLMPGLRRLVRTVSTDLDKAVSFKVLNETGALDRDHYACCQVVLEHMVRNALDHGIEAPEARLAAGKPTAGRITIDVRKSGGDYVIRLADDGKGIDPDAIRESAYEKGLDVDVDALSDEEVIRLIFHKGFSTANTVSEISGRGVGMDIVMTELQKIGGDIQIQSAVGLGTSFEIRIPSNLTVNGALFVTAGENSYAIPLNGLIAVEHVAVDEFYSAVERGETLPLFDMECEPAYLATLCQGESLPESSVWGATVPVIIAGSDERYMAIAIDDVKEALELVVRSLGAQFSAVPGIAGAATTADGEAIVALDLNLLVGSVVSGGIAPVAVTRPKDTTLLALVVDDSRTQRMVATSQLDTVGVETVTAENGQVAIDLLNTTHRLPDVILLDVEMPVKDGIETLREIRKSTRYGHLPVVMVTSRTGAKHRALAKEAGCNAYMGKPFNFPALIEQISDLTGSDLQLT